MKHNLSDFWHSGWDDGLGREEEKRRLLLCLGFTFLWGLLAHAYGFLRGSFSHDMLNALFADGVEVYWKMQLGRFGTVLYRRLIRLPLAMPWLLGVLGLFWMGLALFLTAKLFTLRSPFALFLTAGVFAVNLTVIAMTATYLYEMDMDMMALLAAVAAVFLWARFGWPGTLVGVLLTAGVLSLYQSYLSVILALIMLYCIARLLRGARFGEVFFPGLRSLLMVGLGGGLYYGLLRLMARLKEIPLDTGSYNSVYTALDAGENAPGLLENLGEVYRDFGDSFLNPSASHLSAGQLRLHVLLLALAVLLLLYFLLRGKTGWAEKLLLLALTALLPLGMNASRMLSGADVHDLMKYAFWLIWLLPLLLAAELPRGKGAAIVRALGALLVLLILWGQVQTANAVYLKKDLEQNATLSLMTRVMGRVEQETDYVPGETPVVFVGSETALNPKIYGFEAYYDITGTEFSNAIPYSDSTYFYNVYGAYLRYILNTKIALADGETWQELQRDARVNAMPAYPAAGCVGEVDGVLVVKLGEPVHWPGEDSGERP